MISHGNTKEKGADDPDPVHLVPCGKYRLRNDNSAGDGLNGSIRLGEDQMNAVGADKGDPIRVYAEADGRWILYERKTYSDRPGVGMPKDHREKLGLNNENRTIDLWIGKAKELEPEEDEESKTSSDQKQVSLTGEETQEQEYVLLPVESPITYHHVSTSDRYRTKCGLDFEGQDHRRFSDPGDALDQCSDCAIRSSDDMTNKELVEWLGDQAGFDAEGGTPAYLSKNQLVALRDYILDLQDEKGDEESSSGANAGLSRGSAIG